MKKFAALLILFLIAVNSKSQNVDSQDKLYYTCKIWGFVKYLHSEVSNCKVNWDSILTETLPKVMEAESVEEFNSALYDMLAAAGPMEIATTEPPEEIPEEQKFNLNTSWFTDNILNNNIRDILNSINENFRPHSNCYVIQNDGSGYGWLAFPGNDPILNKNCFIDFPDFGERILILFSYWNIIRYFNPYNNILEESWDSCLYHSVGEFYYADSYKKLTDAIEKLSAKLIDAHVEGLTWSREEFIIGSYRPRIILSIGENDYIVMKSDIEGIPAGSILKAVDGFTVEQLEDSLRPYISAGNEDVFRRSIANYILRGDSNTIERLEFNDPDGNYIDILVERKYLFDEWFMDFYNYGITGLDKWKKWDCNVGYINYGKFEYSEFNSIYNKLNNTKAVIIDFRNSPTYSTIGTIDNYFYPYRKAAAKFLKPDVNFPGTFSWDIAYFGPETNPDYYKGRVIILCNQGTQSHLEYCCMIMQACPDAIVIGSRTAGADGNISRFDLSEDIQAGFTSLGVFYPDGTPTQRIGIVPDIVVYPTPQGIREGRDEVLEKALEVAGCDVSDVYEGSLDILNIYIFPSPATDEITAIIPVDMSVKAKLRFTDFSGKIITPEIISAEITGEYIRFKISTSLLKNGAYYLTAEFGDQKYKGAFIKR